MDALAVPNIREMVLSAVPETDLLVVAVNGQTPLAVEARQWITAWMDAAEIRPRALVGLFDCSKGGSCGPNSAMSFMRAAARIGKVDYFEHLNGKHGRESDCSPASLEVRSNKLSSVLENILERVEPRIGESQGCYLG